MKNRFSNWPTLNLQMRHDELLTRTITQPTNQRVESNLDEMEEELRKRKFDEKA